jgi:hypothetical protein
MIKIYKYPSSTSSVSQPNTKKQNSEEKGILELAYQKHEQEGITKLGIDPFCMNYCTILLTGEIKLFQKSYYKSNSVREQILKQQNLSNITELLDQNKRTDFKDPVLASIAGIKYSEKMLAHRLGRGLRQIDRGSYKYYNRGLYAKFAPEDEVANPVKLITQEKTVDLESYDKLMRKFMFKEALTKALENGDSRKVLGVLEQLMIQDELDTALAQFNDSSSCLLLLKFLAKKMNSENCQGCVGYVTERFIEILREKGEVEEEVKEWVGILLQKVNAELLKETQIDQVRKLLFVGVN